MTFDYPFRVGDLVQIRTSITKVGTPMEDGIIIAIDEVNRMYEVLVNNVVTKVHKSYLVVPKVKSVNFTGGVK